MAITRFRFEKIKLSETPTVNTVNYLGGEALVWTVVRKTLNPDSPGITLGLPLQHGVMLLKVLELVHFFLYQSDIV